MHRLARTTLGALLACGFLSCAQAAVIRAHGDAIELRGQIAADDGDSLQSLMTPAVRVLRLRSPGGDLQGALAIARLVHERDIDVEIDGLCASACAQLILPAASHVRASNGTLVVLHAAGDGAARAARREGRLVADDRQAARSLAGIVALQDAMDEFLASVGVRKPAMDFMYELSSVSDVKVTFSRIDDGQAHVELTGARDPICRNWLVGPEQLRALGVRAAEWSPGGVLKAEFVLGIKGAETYSGPPVEIAPEDHALDCRHFSQRVEQSSR